MRIPILHVEWQNNGVRGKPYIAQYDFRNTKGGGAVQEVFSAQNIADSCTMLEQTNEYLVKDNALCSPGEACRIRVEAEPCSSIVHESAPVWR